MDHSTFDTSADPCTDFYQYACGGYIKSAQIAADREAADWSRDRANEANKQAIHALLTGTGGDGEVATLRQFYGRCLAHTTVDTDEALAGWLAKIDGIRSARDVQAVLRELHGQGIDAWFHYSGEVDRTDREKYRAELDQGSFGARRLYREKDAAAREKYRAHVERMFALAGVKAAAADAKLVLAVEGPLALASLDFGDKFDPDVAEHPMTADRLAKAAPHIEWPAYLALVGHPSGAPINVTSPKYLQALDATLARTPVPALRAALRWSLLATLDGALPRPLAEERQRYKATPGVAAPSPEDACQLATLRALGVELSRQFARFLAPPTRAAARALANAVRDEMADAVAHHPWLSAQARGQTSQKLRQLSIKLGAPDTWPATGTFTFGDSFVASVLAVRAFEQQRAWHRSGQPRSREAWEMTIYPNDAEGMAAARLTLTTAFPDVFTNSIILPAAMLRPPLFDPAAPPEVRYAGFGALVGHELVHVIQNHWADGEGAIRETWTKADIAAASEHKACVVAEASKLPGLDGKRTFDENVADFGGAAHAYATLARELGPAMAARAPDGTTPAQRFFLAYAQWWCRAERPSAAEATLREDVHAPARFRVNGPLANLQAFAQAFACRADAPMARGAGSGCAVW